MKTKLRSWMIAVFLAALVARNGLAESPPAEDDVFDNIRNQMLSAAQKNNALAEENKELKAQLVSLQLEVEGLEQDIAASGPEYIEVRGEPFEPEASSAGLDGSEDDSLIREAQSIYLTGQSMRLDESQKLRELQLYDLQYEKQERQLDVRSAEFVYEKVKDQRRTELEALQAEVKANEAKVQEAALKIAQREKTALSYPQRIDLLEMENKSLKERIKQLQQQLSR